MTELRFQLLHNSDRTLSIVDTSDGNKIVFTGTLAEVGWKRGQMELAAKAPTTRETVQRSRTKLAKRQERIEGGQRV